MTIHPKGTVFGRTKCPACGAPAQIVADRHGKPYMICTAQNDDLKPCYCQLRYGNIAGPKIIHTYEESKANAGQRRSDRPARVQEQPRPDPEPEPRADRDEFDSYLNG